MSWAASEATVRPSLSHSSEASDKLNREQDGEPQGLLAMTEPLSHTQTKRAASLAASKTPTNRRTRWQ